LPVDDDHATVTQYLQALADRFRAAPVLLAVMLLNAAIFGMMVYMMHSANVAANRQAELLEKCLLRR
jgi:uncharacterized membrane protein affecting hemolysin expression